MHNLEPVLENEMHKVLMEFYDINETSYSGQPIDQVIVKKIRPCWTVDFTVSGWPQVKNEGRWKER